MLIVVQEFFSAQLQQLATSHGKESINVIFVGRLIAKNIILKLFMNNIRP
jgi:hypothetical protein